MLRWFESLVYADDAAARQRATELAEAYLARLRTLPAEQLAGKRDEVRHLNDVFRYLARHKIVPNDYAPKLAVEALIKSQGWDKRRP
jgi:hypothetical protein